MRFHWLRLRATVHATEDPDRVANAMRTLSGLEPEAFDACVEASDLETSHGTSVTVVEATLKRAREIRAAMALVVHDPESLQGELEARMDDDGVLYLRFDKQEAYAGRVVPTRGEDAVQVRIKIEAHPATRANAMTAWQTALEAAL